MAANINRRKISEAEIQKSIMIYLQYRKDVVFWRQNSGSFVAPAIRSLGAILDKFGLGRKKAFILAAFKKAVGFYKCVSEQGLPDIIVVHKGMFVGFEVKTDTGRVSKEQKSMHERLRKQGGKVFVVRSIDDVKKAFESLEV